MSEEPMPASDELIAKFQTLCDMKGPLEVARVTMPIEELRALLARRREAAPAAMQHLGNVLVLLAELRDGDRCKALDNALAYYNEHNPTARVEPVDGYETRLVHIGPLDRAEAAPAEEVGALVERLLADDLLYNRGPDYEPLRYPASELRREAAAVLSRLQAERCTWRSAYDKLWSIYSRELAEREAAEQRVADLEQERDEAVRLKVYNHDRWAGASAEAEKQRFRAEAAESRLAAAALRELELRTALAALLDFPGGAYAPLLEEKARAALALPTEEASS